MSQLNIQSFIKSLSTSISSSQEKIKYLSNNTDLLVQESPLDTTNSLPSSTHVIFYNVKKVLTQSKIDELLNKV